VIRQVTEHHRLFAVIADFFRERTRLTQHTKQETIKRKQRRRRREETNIRMSFDRRKVVAAETGLLTTTFKVGASEGET
jgi:hypothetical protein